MVIIDCLIFRKYPEIIFGFSTKKGGNAEAPFFFNLSLSVGDDPHRVEENRSHFFKALGLKKNQVVLQKQIHSSICTYVSEPGICGESDAMITDRKNLGLGVSVADCTPVFIYDRVKRIISAVHSGWRGTEKRIVFSTLERLQADYNSKAEDLIVYVGPSISQKNYEVGKDVADLFSPAYLRPKEDKYLLDVKKANFDMLIEFGIPKKNIQVSTLCTFENRDLLHSYRRDKAQSGRHLGVIALKGENG